METSPAQFSFFLKPLQNWLIKYKQILGHRRIENTLKYIQLAKELFKDQVEYISKIAKTEGEACALIDAGFDFVCDFNGNKLFRKRKN